MEQRLELLILQSNTFATALVGISTANDRQQCLNVASEIRAFVKAWNNVSKALSDPGLESRPAFSRILDRVIIDNSKIINDLRSQLAEVRNKKDALDAAVRGKRWVPSKNKGSQLVLGFLARDTTQLRLQQIAYAESVLDVILGVILHAKTLGIGPVRPQDAQAAIRDQLARLRAESEGKARVFKEERRLGDKHVLSSLWLSTVTWHEDTATQPPFETLALQWFNIVPEDQQYAVERSDTTVDGSKLTRMFMQLQQDLREQSQTHTAQIAEHQSRHDKLRTWAETNMRQLELNHAQTSRNAKEQIEGLTAQLEVQKQKMDTDATTISQLEYARKSWSTHYQKQSERLQHIENEMRGLKVETSQQQMKLDALQTKYERLLAQNQALRKRLEQVEDEKEELSEDFNELQNKHSKVLQENKQWRSYYQNQKHKGNDDPNREAQIQNLRDQIVLAKEEIANLKTDLNEAEGTRDELRNSLTQAETQREEQRHRADHYRERLSSGTPRRECPNSFDQRQHRRHSRSRVRSDASSTSGTTTSRTTSRDGRSRASSSTYIGDDGGDSDREYYDRRASIRRESTTQKPRRIEAWFSPVQLRRDRAFA